MLGMMKYPNFVTEEWSHVLTWDLFVGQWIWLDGLKRGIFTSHSVLLTNFIGPPGFLLHMLTCAVTGKGLPSLDVYSSSAAATAGGDGNAAAGALEGTASSAAADVKANRRAASSTTAESIIESTFAKMYEIRDAGSAAALIAGVCAADVQWEDTAKKQTTVGSAAVRDLLQKRLKKAQGGGSKVSMVIDKMTDGSSSSGGFTWHFEVDGVAGWGLRGTTFVQLNSAGQVSYVREVVEPLSKPGSSIAVLLKAVSERAIKSGNVIVDDRSKGHAESVISTIDVFFPFVLN